VISLSSVASVLAVTRAGAHTIVRPRGDQTRRLRSSVFSLFHCVRGIPPSYHTRGSPPWYNVTTCDHVRPHPLCTQVLTSGETRRIGCVRQSSLFQCARGSLPSYDTRGIPPRYNATTCDHVRRYFLCYQSVTAHAELRLTSVIKCFTTTTN
jgi:hypothetical protein